MINIPSPTSRKFSQINDGDLGTGVLNSTKGVNLFEKGLVSLPNRLVAIENKTRFGEADFQEFEAITYFDGAYYFGGSALYRCTDLSYTGGDLALVSESSSPTSDTCHDMTIFNNRLVYLAAGDIYTRTEANTWATSSTVPAIPATAPLGSCVSFVNKLKLAVADEGYKVKLFDTSYALDATNLLVLPQDFEITCMDWSDNKLYIGTRRKFYGEAFIFEWNGTGAEAQNAYPVGTDAVWSIKKYKSTVVAVTNTGEILQYNGSGFSQFAYFPIYAKKIKWGKASDSKIRKNGITVDGDMLYFGVQGTDINGDYVREFPSGVWCYDPEVGLYHINGLSASLAEAYTFASINTTTDVLTVSSVHDIGNENIPVTGSVVYVHSDSDVAPLTIDRTYYIIKVTASSFKFAETLEDALAGTAINLTSGTSGTFSLYSNKDLSVTEGIDRVVLFNPREYSGVLTQNSDLVWTANIATVATFGCSGTLPVAGSFETVKVFSQNRLDNYNFGVSRLRDIYQDDKFILKYRNDDDPLINSSDVFTLTWTDTNTFTTTADLTGVLDGFEISFVSGHGAGQSVHVSGSPVLATGTWTVNIDENVNSVIASETSKAYVSDYKKIKAVTIDDGLDGQFDTNPVNKGKYIQIKGELRGQNIKFEEFLLNNERLSGLS